MLKKLTILMLLVGSLISVQAQEKKHQLSSHILDVSQGLPAPNVLIKLEKQLEKDTWQFIAENKTDQNGRIQDFLPYEANDVNAGIYRLTYYTKTYFESLNQSSFYPFIEVVFEIKDTQHYHVPITLSPYGYSTYRGN
ncbi:MAG TPA: hydroxyisourate hydrolase [Flavobacterium sp.]|nr:hydroxyisourate hydrolase [Flavobacterium sp.]